MTSTNPSPANPLSMNWSRIWWCNHKKDAFPCSKGELFLPIQFPNSCVILPPSLSLQIGCTNECRWNYRVWFVRSYLFPERYRRSNEMWARARQRCVSRGAVLACSPWSRNNAEQAGGPSTGLATKKPRRYAEHLRKWCKANHQPFPKASL